MSQFSTRASFLLVFCAVRSASSLQTRGILVLWAAPLAAAVTPGFLCGTGSRSGQASPWVEDGASYVLDGSQFPDVDYSGDYRTPVPVDLDGDGNFDVVVGQGWGTIKAYKNVDSTLVADASLLAGAAGTVTGEMFFPAFGDIDGDGDLDLVLGYQGGFYHFENIGTRFVPLWEQRLKKFHSSIQQLSGSSPFVDLLTGERFKPVFVDIDADGDLDYLAVTCYETAFYENTGSATNPVFARREGADNPFNAIPMAGEGGWSISFKDMDADGDFDAIVSDRGHIKVYPNVGSAQSPSFQGTFDSSLGSFHTLTRPDGWDFTGQDWGMPAPQFYPPPTALPGNDDVGAATGDPHLQNIHSERFDLMKPGKALLINIPRGQRVESALLIVEADARRAGEQCADMYFQTLNITGVWADEVRAGGFTFAAGGARDERVQNLSWTRFGPVELKVQHGQTNQGTHYLNFYVKHLGRAGVTVGGLLGEDDHTEAATPVSACLKRISLSKMRSHKQATILSVATATRE